MVQFWTTSKRWTWELALTTSVLIGGPALEADTAAVQAGDIIKVATSRAVKTPEPLEPLPAVTAPKLDSIDSEIVRERYVSRKIKTERRVVRDENGNFVNHGRWEMWNEQGQSMGFGQYRHGQRAGTWLRTFQAGEAPIFSGPWGKLFEAPLLASGTFNEGQLDGVWAVVDALERPVMSWHYAEGQRSGKSVWYFPNGKKYREANYTNGQLDGPFIEWSAEGAVVAEESYLEGRRRGKYIEHHDQDTPKSEIEYLFAAEMIEVTEDWWAGISESRVVGTSGRDMKNGHYITWYRNGQKAIEGEYRDDQPIGKFTWWHPNGLRAIEGSYVGGVQNGRWSWWHASGKRYIQGHYRDGEQVDEWTWWNEAGGVTLQTNCSDLGDEEEEVTPPIPEPSLYNRAASVQVKESKPVEVIKPAIEKAPVVAKSEEQLDSSPAPRTTAKALQPIVAKSDVQPASGVQSVPRFELLVEPHVSTPQPKTTAVVRTAKLHYPDSVRTQFKSDEPELFVPPVPPAPPVFQPQMRVVR